MDIDARKHPPRLEWDDMDDNDTTAPPRITGAPDAIWLVYGELEHDDTHLAFCRDGEVTWCEDSQYPSDVRYVRADLYEAQAAEIERLRKDAERLDWLEQGFVDTAFLRADDDGLVEMWFDDAGPPVRAKTVREVIDAAKESKHAE